jgi:F0F1-type ATP synthase membrane subunit c/vacuolar-type H+-ATPase subunit K
MLPNQPEAQAKLDAQYRTMIILWLAFLSSIVMYVFIGLIVPRQAATENGLLALVFSAVSAFLVVVSFAVKKKFFTRAVDEQQVRLVSTGFILAAALCEGGALFGLLDLFIAHERYYLILIAFSFLGLLAHFPRRNDLVAASFKSNSPLT